MLRWTLSVSPRAQKDLITIDRKIAEQILVKLSWLENNFNSIIPRRLSGDLSDSFKLRVGDYRVIYEINTRRSIIYVYRIEHRSKVYRK